MKLDYVKNTYLHHVLENICLCISVAVSLGLADNAVVLKEEDVTVVTSRGRSNSRSTLPHLERPLVGESKHMQTVKCLCVIKTLHSRQLRGTCLIGSPRTSRVAG